MEATTIDVPPAETESTPLARPRSWRDRAVFVATFLGAWLGLELTVTSPPAAASGMAAVLAAGGVLLVSAALTSGDSPVEMARRIGLGPPNARGLLAATIVGGGVFAAYVVGAALFGIDLEVRANWPTVLVGALLFHGLAEELVWRGFAFGHLRRRHRFWGAIAWSVPLIALTHVPIIAGNGVAIGTLAVLTAAVTCLPFAYLWEQSGRTVWAPAIVHGLQGTWQLFERTYGDGFSVLILVTSLTVPLTAFLFRRSFFEPDRT
jgi:membrane protease YdiL (CAAX protease family)